MKTSYKNIPKDPDFDLDEYIREKSLETDETSFQHLPEKDRTDFKNAILIFMVFAAAFLWYHDWSPSQAWNSVFGSEEFSVNVDPNPDININLPEIEIPDLPPVPASNTEGGFVEYLTAVRDAGLNDVYSNSGFQALYQTGVPVDYLKRMVEAGYQELSYSSVIGLFRSGVTIDYLNQLSEDGYLNRFSYSAIMALYNGGVSIDYLNALNEGNYLDDLSYSAIIGLFNGGVTIDYLNQLSKYNYNEKFSYSAIIGMYNTGVTVDFIKKLEDNDLLKSMNYSDIISAFMTDQ